VENLSHLENFSHLHILIITNPNPNPNPDLNPTLNPDPNPNFNPSSNLNPNPYCCMWELFSGATNFLLHRIGVLRASLLYGLLTQARSGST